MLCHKCLHEIEIGQWPWCPHPSDGKGGAISDSIRGGLVMEHLLPGHKVYSKSELKKTLARHGFQLDETNSSTDRIKDKFNSKWF